MTTPAEIQKQLKAAVSVRREDVAQAKQFAMRDGYSGTEGFLNRWLEGMKFHQPEWVVFPTPEYHATIAQMARGFSLRMAMYQAVWELIASGEVVPIDTAKEWTPEVGYHIHNGRSSMRLDALKTYFMPEIQRLPQIDGVPGDADIFLHGVDCRTLHPGIREAIDQSLGCFRRGLYMPATAMLAAAAEATWTECGVKVAAKLGNAKLDGVVSDPYASISKKVTETRKALDAPDGRAILKATDRTIADVNNAELWTTALRERRNALHWDKAKSFVADHSETGTLLMAAPQHLGTLEAIRATC